MKQEITALRGVLDLMKEEEIFYSSQKNTAKKTLLEKKAEANKKTTDAATKNETEMQIAQRKARDNLQDFVNFGIDPVTKVVEILSKVVEWLTDFLPGAGERKRQREIQKKVEATPTTRRMEWEGDKLVEKQVGANKGLSGKDLSGLDKGFADAITRAANEYNQITLSQLNHYRCLIVLAKNLHILDQVNCLDKENKTKIENDRAESKQGKSSKLKKKKTHSKDDKKPTFVVVKLKQRQF